MPAPVPGLKPTSPVTAEVGTLVTADCARTTKFPADRRFTGAGPLPMPPTPPEPVTPTEVTTPPDPDPDTEPDPDEPPAEPEAEDDPATMGLSPPPPHPAKTAVSTKAVVQIDFLKPRWVEYICFLRFVETSKPEHAPIKRQSRYVSAHWENQCHAGRALLPCRCSAAMTAIHTAAEIAFFATKFIAESDPPRSIEGRICRRCVGHRPQGHQKQPQIAIAPK